MAMCSYLDLMFKKIKENVLALKESLNKDVVIVCASKYYTVEVMRYLYSLGITHFGESRTNELLEKKEFLKDLNITWHFIGTLQSNKVKEIINEIDYLHSLERISLAKEINKHRKEPLNCFIQLNLSNEETKSGLNEETLAPFLINIKKYDKIKPIGLMQMGVYGNLEASSLTYEKVSDLNKKHNLNEISMGMSDDYIVAVNNGATFIRIGSLFTK